MQDSSTLPHEVLYLFITGLEMKPVPDTCLLKLGRQGSLLFYLVCLTRQMENEEVAGGKDTPELGIALHSSGYLVEEGRISQRGADIPTQDNPPANLPANSSSASG